MLEWGSRDLRAGSMKEKDNPDLRAGIKQEEEIDKEVEVNLLIELKKFKKMMKFYKFEPKMNQEV